jgi:hypothetical protein
MSGPRVFSYEETRDHGRREFLFGSCFGCLLGTIAVTALIFFAAWVNYQAMRPRIEANMERPR